jgi:hypothetical protein
MRVSLHDRCSFLWKEGLDMVVQTPATKVAAGATDVSTNGIRLYFLPGVDYFVNDHVAAELGLEYLFIAGTPDAQIVALNLGFQIFLGGNELANEANEDV